MPYRRRSYSRSLSRSRSPYRRQRVDGTALKRDPPSRCSLLLRNLPKDARESDLRYYSEKYGPVRDVYLPRDYYTGEPRGIGFVEYTCPRDAEDAKYGLDGTIILDREMTAVFAMQGRKRPEEYRRRESSYRHVSGRYRHHSYSRSPRKRRKRSITKSSSTRKSSSGYSRRRQRSHSEEKRKHSNSGTTSSKRSDESRSLDEDRTSYSSGEKKSTGKVSVDDPDNSSLERHPALNK